MTWIMGGDLSPHGFCLNWEPHLLALTLIGHAGIAAAYMVIPLVILMEARRNRIMLQPWLLGLFAGFIWLCGLSHLLAVWTLFHPAYWLEAGELTATAVISLFTLVLMPFAKVRSDLTLQWWRRARALKHEQNNLRATIEGLCARGGVPVPIWPADEDLPEAPEER